MALRWADKDKPKPPEDTRTAEEIIDHIRKGLEEVSQRGLDGIGCNHTN